MAGDFDEKQEAEGAAEKNLSDFTDLGVSLQNEAPLPSPQLGLFSEEEEEKKPAAFSSAQQLVMEVFKALEHPDYDVWGDSLIPTGFRLLDRQLAGGFKGSELIVLAGRSDAGKTTLALDIARYAALERGRGVVIFSPALPARQIMGRMMAAHCRIPQLLMREDEFDKWASFTTAAGQMSDAEIHVNDKAGIDISELVQKVGQFMYEHAALPRAWLVIIDYLQLIQASRSPGKTRAEEYNEIYQALKNMARTWGAAVVVISLTDQGENEQSEPPQLSDLRGFGMLEQYADLILFLHRERETSAFDPNIPAKETVEVIMAKNRLGTTPEAVKLNFIPQYPRFENPERDLRLIL